MVLHTLVHTCRWEATNRSCSLGSIIFLGMPAYLAYMYVLKVGLHSDKYLAVE